jgi:hypothetical protein
VIRHCADCGAPFSLEPEEEDWFRREGLTLPKRCGSCRASRRGARDRYLTCTRCGRTFTYPRELQLYARSYGWGTPSRCISGCADGGIVDETDEERAMRELLEGLHARRRRGDAPPIEAVLDARRSRPRSPTPSPRSPDSLFQSLDGPDEGGEGASLRDSVERFKLERTRPDELFGGLGTANGEEDEPHGEARQRKKKKRRPRPKH